MYINLRDLVLLENYCGDLNKSFAMLFGNKMELTPQNLEKLLEKSDRCVEDIFDYVLNEVDEKVIRELAIYLNIEFCNRCWNLYDIFDDVMAGLESLPKNRKLLAAIDLIKMVMKVEK